MSTVARTPAPPAWTSSLAAVLAHGLWTERRSPLTWGGGLGAMCALVAAMWPSVADAIGKAIASYPASIKAAFGIQALTNVQQYVDVEMLSFVAPLTLAFFAVRCVTRALVGAEDAGYLDALLALPLSRRVLAAGAFLVAGILLAAMLAIAWGMTCLAAALAGAHPAPGVLARGFANVWPLAIAFAGLAVFVSGLVRHPATVTAIAAGTLVAMYVLDLVGKLAPDAHALRTLSAFRYYGSAIQDGLDASHMVGLTLAGVLLCAAGAVLFDRRDLG